MLVKIVLLFIATILAFWISAICGGGASLVLVPILNMILPIAFVPFSLTVGTFTSSASRIAVFKHQINWKIVFWFVPFSIPAVLLGAWFMKYVNPLYLEILVALLLLANIPEFFRKKQQLNVTRPYSKFVLAIVGLLAGFISGVTGAIGLLFNRFYLRYGLTKEQIIATRAANEICLHTIKLIIYLLLGLYSQNAVLLGLTIALSSIVSSYCIQFVLPFLSEYLFRKIGYGAMVVSGMVLLVSTLQTIVQKDNIAFGKNKYDETTMNWRNSNFVLEFAFSDGLEVERQIHENELPTHLKNKFAELKSQYDEIFLEKVHKVGSANSFEFYCYKSNKLKKIEFKE